MLHVIARRVPLQTMTIDPLRRFSEEASNINQSAMNTNVPGLPLSPVNKYSAQASAHYSARITFVPVFTSPRIGDFGYWACASLDSTLIVPSLEDTATRVCAPAYANMFIIARNRLLSALGEHAHVARHSYSSICHSNAAYRRTLANKVRKAHYATTTLTSKDEIRELMAVWPDIVRDVTESKISEVPDISEWIAKVLQYNLPGAKKIRSVALIYAYKLLAPSDHLTEENIRLVRILAWCMDIVASVFIVYDDIQDRSLIRRNQPCWYRHNDIGLAAINDCVLMECIIYFLLQKHFKGKECYMDIVEIFQEIILMTSMGQCLDLLSSNFGKKPDLNLFTMDRYNNIANHKCSYIMYYFPVTLAMHLVGIKDPEKLRQTKPILFEMGHLYQVQDDYLGCYGKLEVKGKNNTDIQGGKCTWLIVTALQRATSEQRKILEECYGSWDPEKVQRVIQIYNDLDLPNTYSIYEEETYNMLITHIQQISHDLPHDLFLKLLNKIYRRQKL